MSENEAFEKLWAIKGHAEAIVSAIKLEGVNDSKLKLMNNTIDRMKELMNECLNYRGLKP